MGPINGGPINLSFARLQARLVPLRHADRGRPREADLSDADLSEARLNGANLSGADLSDALLDQADFAGAHSPAPISSGASLLEARNLTQAQIDEAMGDAFTLLPPHLSRPEGWGGPVSQVVSDHQVRNGAHAAPPNGQGGADPGRDRVLARRRAAAARCSCRLAASYA